MSHSSTSVALSKPPTAAGDRVRAATFVASPADATRLHPRDVSRARAWLVTLGATAASTYLLDVFAASVGVLLVASNLLAGVDRDWLAVFLVATYGAWGVGLRVNMRANGRLLEATGTSTNVLSKAAYDVTRARGCGRRTQSVAAAIGYLGTELAKEVPYYVGAFGSASLSDSVSSNDALVFLAGTNLAAGAYEYGVGRITFAFLRVRSSRAGRPGDPAA
jgi:hypothetical protein